MKNDRKYIFEFNLFLGVLNLIFTRQSLKREYKHFYTYIRLNQNV